jgi:thiamine pyrophosphokinase
MAKLLMITAHVEQESMLDMDFDAFDRVLCADGGLLVAKRLGITPDCFIGDYDSAAQPEVDGVIKLPVEKDMTDSEAAIDLAAAQGFDEITVLGGLGGRFDHTMGNLGLLAKYCGKLTRLELVDGQNRVFMMAPGKISIPKSRFPYLGVISYGGTASGVTLRGVKYPLTDYLLTNATTLGVSNEIIADSAEISFTDGRLLIILSRDVRQQNS